MGIIGIANARIVLNVSPMARQILLSPRIFLWNLGANLSNMVRSKELEDIVSKDVDDAVVRLKNARLELELLREHENDTARTFHALGLGVIENAISYLNSGKIYTRRGLHTAILFALD